MRLLIFYIICIAILLVLAVVGIRIDADSFLGSLFAAFLSVFLVIFVEIELRPRIEIEVERSAPVLADGRKFLRVIVRNKPLWWPLNRVMDRRPAYLTRAWITFLTETNDLVFAERRRMIGRWSNTPEPIRPMSIVGNPAQPSSVTLIGLRDLSITRDAVDISSGGSEVLDIVMRGPNTDGCRGWNNQIIENPDVAPEYRFNLPRGRYRALVQVETAGRSTYAIFRIVCDVGIVDFRLEPLRLTREALRRANIG